MLLKCLLLFSIIYNYYCLKKFTIHSEGKNIITAKVTNQDICSSIAITQNGAYIRYKSDSSIISLKIYNEDIDLTTDQDSNYFMCQFSTNLIILFRGTEMTEIILDGKGNLVSKESSITPNIISLQCNLGNYIITYLTDDNKKYNYKIYSSSFNLKNSFNSQLFTSSIISSSLSVFGKYSSFFVI